VLLVIRGDADVAGDEFARVLEIGERGQGRQGGLLYTRLVMVCTGFASGGRGEARPPIVGEARMSDKG